MSDVAASVGNRPRRLRPLALVACAFALAGCAPSDDYAASDDKARATHSWRDPRPEATPANQPTGPALVVRATDDRAHAEGRGRDQYNHPEYLALTAPWIAAIFASGGSDTRLAHDPYRVDWATTRGTIEEVSFRNRYGALLRGRLFGPKPLPTVPAPVVLFVPGRFAPSANSPFTGFANYENLLQSLAEAGYLVFAIGPQGQDGSEYFTPPHPFCEPGAWNEPQEFGLRELGECAGQEGPFSGWRGAYASAYQAADDAAGNSTPSYGAQGQLEIGAALEQRAEGYTEFETRFVFAALDGAEFLLSRDNPWRGLVDEKHLGIVGHSAGGHAALIVGNGDRKRRFGAVVALDSYGFPPDSVAPGAPSLVQMAERQNEFGPYEAAPPSHLWPPYRVYRRFVEEREPAMLVALRGSTHHEWSYVPHALTNPVSPLQNASSRGGQVGLYYTLAWLDLWLRPEHAAIARQRLFAEQFDDSVDTTSIGAGTYDFAARRNAPYAIAGEAIADHLSVLLPSQAHFGDMACEDLQAGCGGLR